MRATTSCFLYTEEQIWERTDKSEILFLKKKLFFLINLCEWCFFSPYLWGFQWKYQNAVLYTQKYSGCNIISSGSGYLKYKNNCFKAIKPELFF